MVLGHRARFGLAATDFATQERTPRPAAAYFADACKTNALPEPPPTGRAEDSAHDAA